MHHLIKSSSHFELKIEKIICLLAKAKPLVEVEGGGAGVALDNGVGVVGGDQLVVGEQVRSSLEAGGGDLLRDSQGQAVGALDDAEGPGGLSAGGVLDVGQSATDVGGDLGRALDASRLHGAGLDDSEGVQALGAVADAAG